MEGPTSSGGSRNRLTCLNLQEHDDDDDDDDDICIFNRDLYNYFDNFHILGTLPVYGYMENKVSEWMNEALLFL